MAVRVSNQRSSSSLRMGAESRYRNQHPVEVEDDDDDEECTVVGMQNVSIVKFDIFCIKLHNVL